MSKTVLHSKIIKMCSFELEHTEQQSICFIKYSINWLHASIIFSNYHSPWSYPKKCLNVCVSQSSQELLCAQWITVNGASSLHIVYFQAASGTSDTRTCVQA